MTVTRVKLAQELIICLTGIVVHQALVIRRMKEELEFRRIQRMHMLELANYLFKIIEENNIEFDPFDMIALMAMFEDVNIDRGKVENA